MADKKQDQKKEEGKSKEKKSNQLPLVLVFFGVNLLGLIVGTYLVFFSTFLFHTTSLSEEELQKQMEEEWKQESMESLLYTMATFNANLDGIPRRLIQIQVNLSMLDTEGFEEIVSLEAKARDTIIRILNTKSFRDIESVQGKLRLKNQIINQLNAFLKRGIVKGIYFSSFAVQ